MYLRRELGQPAGVYHGIKPGHLGDWAAKKCNEVQRHYLAELGNKRLRVTDLGPGLKDHAALGPT